MRNRLFGMALTACMSITLLAGCAGNGANAAKQTTSKTTKGSKLVLWTNLEVEADELQQLGDEWGKDNNCSVKVIHKSPSVQEFAQAVKSKDGPDAVVGIPNDQLADYINAGLAQETPSDLYKDEDFSDAAIQASYIDGKRYAEPISVETNSLFVNTDLVKEIPKTWEDLVAGAKDVGGVQFDATSIYYDLGFVRAEDGYIFKYENGKYDVNDIGLDTFYCLFHLPVLSRFHSTYDALQSDHPVPCLWQLMQSELFSSSGRVSSEEIRLLFRVFFQSLQRFQTTYL